MHFQPRSFARLSSMKPSPFIIAWPLFRGGRKNFLEFSENNNYQPNMVDIMVYKPNPVNIKNFQQHRKLPPNARTHLDTSNSSRKSWKLLRNREEIKNRNRQMEYFLLLVKFRGFRLFLPRPSSPKETLHCIPLFNYIFKGLFMSLSFASFPVLFVK